VLFLTWSDQVQAFMPWNGNALLADITNDAVAPFRVLDTPAAIIAGHTGESASDFIRDLRAVVRGSR